MFSLFHNPRYGQIWYQVLPDSDGTASGAAAAMGSLECLVEIKLDYIKAQIPRLRNTHEGIGIGAVAV